MDDAKSEKMRF